MNEKETIREDNAEAGGKRLSFWQKKRQRVGNGAIRVIRVEVLLFPASVVRVRRGQL